MPPFKDLQGKKFNKLTVVKKTYKPNSKNVLWECICECGNTRLLNSSQLTKNIIKCCGCSIKYSRYELNPGDVYNSLTIIKPVIKNKKQHWLCKCECGNETIYKAGIIVKGIVKTCGCRINIQYNIKNHCVFLEKENYMVGKTKKSKEFIFDVRDFDLISKYNWIISNEGYVKTFIKDEVIYMHNLLMPKKEGHVVDHINRVKTDNRRENLRYATPYQNSLNKSLCKRNTSGKIGVSKYDDKWLAQITVKGKTMHLGLFKCLEEAIETRIKAEIKYFGEFRGE